MSPLQRELLHVALLLLGFVLIIGMVELATRKKVLACEAARKAVHILGGVGCLLFPFVITSWISVLGLALLLAALLYFGERSKRLLSLSSVERSSYGSALFPFAVLILFVCSQGQRWFYIAGLLVLVLADSAAALVGSRYGRIHFQTIPGEKKSLEGALVFFVVGFITVYLSLLLLADMPQVSALFCALLLAVLLAGLEAVSIGGTDNLYVPIAACFLLDKVPSKPPEEILFQLFSLGLLALLVYRINRQEKTLRTRSLILFILVVYAAWSLGSADWLIAVLSGFVLYLLLCKPCAPLKPDLSARELLRPLYVPLGILFGANALECLAFWFAPFVLAAALTTSLCIINRYRVGTDSGQLPGCVLLPTLFLPGAIPLLLCLPLQGRVIFSVLPGLVALSALVTFLHHRFTRMPLSGFAWNYAIPLYSGISVLIYAGLQFLGLLPLLDPGTWAEVFR